MWRDQIRAFIKWHRKSRRNAQKILQAIAFAVAVRPAPEYPILRERNAGEIRNLLGSAKAQEAAAYATALGFPRSPLKFFRASLHFEDTFCLFFSRHARMRPSPIATVEHSFSISA